MVPFSLPRPGMADAEGARVPDGVRVFDGHVHLFPERVFEALWRWFEAHAWPIRYRLYAEEVVRFQLDRGVERFCALHYAHKPGMARSLNEFVRDLARAHSQIVPFGTVMPGEPDAAQIVKDAFAMGLRGIKLHCHVQKLAADDPRLEPVYEICALEGLPVLIHAGREPSTLAYGVDTRALCAADQIARVLERHPKLKLVVPHLGADEFAAYAALLSRYDNLWLDTTMAIAGFFGEEPPASLFPGRVDRLIYGTDFPNIPYAWDRELRRVLDTVPEAEREKILWSNAKHVLDA